MPLFSKPPLPGYIMLMAVIFSAVFLTVIGSMVSRVVVESSAQVSKMERTQALAIAEAGLEYYKWFLAHNPGDLTHGTGQPGPYVIPYTDPETGQTGSYSLSISGNSLCGQVQSIDIASTGWTDSDPTIKVTLTARYARPSVAEYSFILNDSVWAGADRVITGPYHSNGGIRMDGTSNSKVTSAVQNWWCTSSFGCNPSATTSGVWGSGSLSSLWEVAVDQFDFGQISQDLALLKGYAQNNGGLYFGNQGGDSNPRRGYRVRFNGNGTVTVWRVTNANGVNGYHIDTGWQTDYFVYTNTQSLGTYTIPVSCPLLFFEDRVWLEGTVDMKTTIIAADLLYANYNPDILVKNDIQYATYDGTDGLTAISEGYIYTTPDAENNLRMDGIYIAQKGYMGTNLYTCQYPSYTQKNSLTMYGSTISAKRTGTKWSYSGYGCGSNQWAGFNTRTNDYDRNLLTNPPPFTPYTSSEWRFIEWREQY